MNDIASRRKTGGFSKAGTVTSLTAVGAFGVQTHTVAARKNRYSEANSAGEDGFRWISLSHSAA